MATDALNRRARSNRPLAAFIGVVIVLSILVAMFYGYHAFGTPKAASTSSVVAASTPSPTASGPTPTPNPTAIAATSTPAPAPVADPTAKWLTNTNTTYHASIKYPQTWGAPAASTVTPGADSDPWAYQSDVLNFGNTNKTITYSSFDSYRNSSNFTPLLDQEIHQLADVFTNQSASGVTSFWLPPSNAGIFYHTTPQYMASSDGKFRGTYYYAVIGQDYPPQVNGAYKLNDFVATLSDGTATIVQVEQYASVATPDTATYQAIDCVDSSGTKTNCVVNDQLLTNFTNEYQPVLQSLTSVK